MAQSENIKRVQIRLPNDEFAKLKSWSRKLGVTMGQLGGMATQAGLDGIIRAVSPIDSVTTEKWAEIIEAMEQNKARKIA